MAEGNRSICKSEKSGGPRTWLDACFDFYRSTVHDFPVLGKLNAFAAAYPRGGGISPAELIHQGSFEQLEAQIIENNGLPDISEWIADEIDREQIDIFARRLAAVDSLLHQIIHPAARILRVGLRVRLAGILDARPPYATRLRALADFYYSQGALLVHVVREQSAGRCLPSRSEQVRGLRWNEVGPGLMHAFIGGTGQDGPMHINVLKVDPKRVEISTIRTEGRTDDKKDFGKFVINQGALAGISGGFFLYSEPDIRIPSRRFDPVGLLIHKGKIVSPPIFNRSCLLVGQEKNLKIGRIGLPQVELRINNRAISLDHAVNRAMTELGPESRSVAIVGHQVVAIGYRLEVPLNGCVVPVDHDEPISIHDSVTWCFTDSDRSSYVEGIAGGPMLLCKSKVSIDMEREQFWRTAPPLTFSQDETGDQNLLGRLAVGIDEQDRLVVAAVDGRNVKKALGMTLAQTGQLMLALGCHTAINLDGGSSKRMAIGNQIVDLPSTEMLTNTSQPSFVRPVHTCILFSSSNLH